MKFVVRTLLTFKIILLKIHTETAPRVILAFNLITILKIEKIITILKNIQGNPKFEIIPHFNF